MASTPSAPAVAAPPPVDPFAAFTAGPVIGGDPGAPPPGPNGLNTGPTLNPYANPIDPNSPNAPPPTIGTGPVQGYGVQSGAQQTQAGIGGGSGGYGIRPATDPAMNAFRRIRPASGGVGSAGMSGAQPADPASL